jgi:hypothetical protein
MSMMNTTPEQDQDIQQYLTQKSVGETQFQLFLCLYILISLAAGEPFFPLVLPGSHFHQLIKVSRFNEKTSFVMDL